MISGINGGSSLMGNMRMGAMRPDPAERFNKADANGDGGLDKSEMQTVLDKVSEMSGQDIDVENIFSEFDTDKDGMLSEQEAETAMNQLREELGPQMRGMKGGMGGQHPPGMGDHGINGGGESESSLISMFNSLSEDEKESFLDALDDDSEDDEDSTIADMLRGALERGSYSPVDILV